MWNLLADDEEHIERWRFVVLPFKANDIFQFSLLYAAPADIHGDIFILVGVLQQLPDGIDWVPVQFLDAWGWECHSYDAASNVSEVEVVSVFFETVFGTANYLSQEVHFITSNNNLLATLYWYRKSSNDGDYCWNYTMIQESGP